MLLSIGKVRKSDGKCLVLRFSMNEKVHPVKFATLGGKLEWSDFDLGNQTRMNGAVLDFEGAVENLLAREVAEEAGTEVHKDMQYVGSVAFVRPDGIPVVLVQFAMRFKDGEVKLKEGASDDFAWVDAKEVKQCDCIEGVSWEVGRTIEIFSRDDRIE